LNKTQPQVVFRDGGFFTVLFVCLPESETNPDADAYQQQA
jgi:hypothetical protein